MISANNVTKQYNDFTLNISMQVVPGCITGLVGKNGSGKSTTIKSMLGLIKPDSGEIHILGKEPNELTPDDKQSLGVALSDSGFSAYLTVNDVIHILKKSYHNFDVNSFTRKCKELGLPTNKLIQKFSSGMKAKLRVLVALSHNAKLIIMDEPTAGMDVQARNEILDLLRNYVTEHEDSSILITSHIATDLESLCDDIYLINNGTIVLHEDTDVILSDYAVLKIEDRTFQSLDKSYVISTKKEQYHYCCLTNQKQFYMENYPGIIIEKCGIDVLILLLTGGQSNEWTN